MTLPALVQNYQGKILKEQLTKQYSAITNIMQKMNYDLGNLKVEDFEHSTFAPQFKKYLNKIKDCQNVGCEDLGITDENGTTRVSKNYKTYNNQNLTNGFLDDGQMITTDGAFYLIENVGHTGKIFISVDVNGLYKKPNRWGHDLFTFQIFDNGKVVPMGAEGTTYSGANNCSATSTSTTNGIGCTYKALTDKNYFRNLPK